MAEGGRLGFVVSALAHARNVRSSLLAIKEKYLYPALSVFFCLGRLVLQIELFEFVEGQSHFEKT